MGFDKDSYEASRHLCRAFVARCDAVYGNTPEDVLKEHAVNFFIGAGAAAKMAGNERLAIAMLRFIEGPLLKHGLTAVRHLALLGLLPDHTPNNG